MALQRRKMDHAFPRDAGNLELWFGLWRQRAAREEVLRASHRRRHGARRRLARRAHADPETDLARGSREISGGSVPKRVRQDQSRHVAAYAQRLESGDDWRRHRLDAFWRRW